MVPIHSHENILVTPEQKTAMRPRTSGSSLQDVEVAENRPRSKSGSPSKNRLVEIMRHLQSTHTPAKQHIRRKLTNSLNSDILLLPILLSMWEIPFRLGFERQGQEGTLSTAVGLSEDLMLLMFRLICSDGIASVKCSWRAMLFRFSVKTIWDFVSALCINVLPFVPFAVLITCGIAPYETRLLSFFRLLYLGKARTRILARVKANHNSQGFYFVTESMILVILVSL